MYPLSDSTSDVDILDKECEELGIVKDTEESNTSDKQSIVLIDDELEMDILSYFDHLLCEKFGVAKSKIHEHRKEIIEACLRCFQSNSKIADIVNVENVNKLHVGHILHITETIVLNADTNELELDAQKLRGYKDYFPMIDRMHWLAQPSLEEREFLKGPARYVIICHTATQEAFTQAENILMLRITQTFHTESQGWADVAYNFCIGSDGNAYEGRGWFVQGSHTLSYNACSVGIGFIGCFFKHLPPPTSLKRCKDLIAHGVQVGAIHPEYELIAHCQCRPFSSPGERLVEEIQTWKNFNPNITNTMTVCQFKEM